RDQIGDGTAEVAPVAPGAQGNRSALTLVAVGGGLRNAVACRLSIGLGRIAERAFARRLGRDRLDLARFVRRLGGAILVDVAVVHIYVGGHVGGVAGYRIDRGDVVGDDVLRGQVLVHVHGVVVH